MFPKRYWLRCGLMTAALFGAIAGASEPISLTLRTATTSADSQDEIVWAYREETWQPEQTAIIVCDVWDYHHSRNAVDRLEAFAPRLNELLIEARRRGVTIIHAPSDCMDYYRDHSARKRAQSTPQASNIPYAIDSWCSAIPSEKSGIYPIDQSDGGEDDDPEQLAVWREKLASMGRNPQLPWQAQSPTIMIDEELDFISDSGREVWNILMHRKIRNVILTGVHVNMCVLGRPFGLRQMARTGMNVVLMRDLTDSMYNPESWPYVDHHEGTRRVIEHIERYVCPTISSDQFMGGEEFQLSRVDVKAQIEAAEQSPTMQRKRRWDLISLPMSSEDAVQGEGMLWLRCTAFIPKEWITADLGLQVSGVSEFEYADQQVWVNGQLATAKHDSSNEVFVHRFPADAVVPNDVNLIVVAMKPRPIHQAFLLQGEGIEFPLEGRWQFTLDTSGADLSSLPLPAKFGMGPDVLFTPVK
ncbi:hypothetical protein SH449x_005218 [Pirellulaceae bacterium SH449]